MPQVDGRRTNLMSSVDIVKQSSWNLCGCTCVLRNISYSIRPRIYIFGGRLSYHPRQSQHITRVMGSIWALRVLLRRQGWMGVKCSIRANDKRGENVQAVYMGNPTVPLGVTLKLSNRSNNQYIPQKH